MFNFIRNKQTFTYYPLLAILLITAQLAATCLGPRIIKIDDVILPGGITSFPLTFFFLDIITEVYGFNRARQIIFYYLIGQIFFALLISVGMHMPVAPFVPQKSAYVAALNHVDKLTVCVVAAIVLGDYVNCYVLAKIKNYSNGQYLWMRLIGSTAVGELVTSVTWVVLFFSHENVHPNFIKLVLCQYAIKIIFEIIFIVPTYVIVSYLRRAEGVDANKKYINFDPITMMPLTRN